MHLVPEERRDHRILDGERVCRAICAIGKPANIGTWAERFSILGDPTRLALLLAIVEAGPISVTDLAVATDVNATTVSQALRLLRASGTVIARRDGRIMRYTLADQQVARLLMLAKAHPRIAAASARPSPTGTESHPHLS